MSDSDDKRNLIPGDSKFTRNLLRPRREETANILDSDRLAIPSPLNSETALARSCLQQVNNEAATRRARYFYVITNRELFLCRRTQDPPVDSPIAARTTKRVRASHLNSTPTRPHAIPPSSPPSITSRSQRPAVSLDQVVADLPSSPPASPATPVSRKPCVSKCHC